VQAVQAPPRALVLGIVPSLTWTVTRCLARAGMRPVVLGWHRVSPMLLTPDCTYVPLREVRWDDGELEPRVLDQVETACRAHRIDRVVPVDFSSVFLFSRHGASFRAAPVTAVPDASTMLELHNKWNFSRAIEQLGLLQPRTHVADRLEALVDSPLPYPIITKPLDRWASVGFQIHHGRAELLQKVARGELQARFPLLVQEYIPGRDVGFAFIARHGKLVAYTAFEQPQRGVRRHFDAPELRDAVAKLLAARRYHGVGEIDARQDPSRGEYRLLEINPRFWASALYAEHAGMNFPELLVRLDELGDGPGFCASDAAVRLTPYELLVARCVLLAESAKRLTSRFRVE
jgi:predicted ATP-grasp superfamily ATP-dependent carboligase